jgi:hypothetical protein
MGVKFELFLVVLIVATLGYMMSVKLRNHTYVVSDGYKELEFYDTSFTEVNRTGFVSASYGAHGVYAGGVLSVETFRYKDNEVANMHARYAEKENETIRLSGDVEFRRYDGFVFHTRVAVYREAVGVAEALTPFTAYEGENVFRGMYMRYDMKADEIYATKVKAAFPISPLKERNVSRSNGKV